MSIYECTMVDSEREPTPYVRYPNVEMVDTKREPTPYVRCTYVSQHTMDANFSTLDIHPSYDQREALAEPMDGPRDVETMTFFLQPILVHCRPCGSKKNTAKLYIKMTN